MAEASDTTRTPCAHQADKLHGLISSGEDHITRIEALLAAASALTDNLAEAEHVALTALRGKASLGTADGLAAVMDTVNDRVRELRTWWTQLHEMGVVASREASHV